MDNEPQLELQVMDSKQPLFEASTVYSKPNIWQSLLFTPVYKTMKLAQRVTLEENMIEDLTPNEGSAFLHSKFKSNLNNRSISVALMTTFGCELMLVFLILLLLTLGQMAIPVLIKLVIDYIMAEEKAVSTGVYLVLTIFIVRVSNVFTQSHSRSLIRRLGYDAMSVVSMEVLNKTLKVSFLSNRQHTSGQVLNLMQIDCSKLILVTTYISGVAMIPLQLGLSLYLMELLIGISFVVGLIIIFLSIFFNVIIGRLTIKRQNQLMKDKDARTRCANEVFSSIKFIKINALEEYFQKKITELRNKEVQTLRGRLNLAAIQCLVVWFTPQMILSCTFGVYVLLGHNLTPSNTFAIISIFQTLQQPLMQLPMAFTSLIEAKISLKRIEAFLGTNEVQVSCIRKSEYKDPTNAIEITNGTFYWPSKTNQTNLKNQMQGFSGDVFAPTLRNINFKVLPGQFISIVGDVGAGKTSLLQCLLGEMLYFEGYQQPKIRVNGLIAYVSQKTWIQNATVRENILFGHRYDEERYEQAIYYACLKDDLEILVKGDETMIGEKGINLSGGQKARVSLARAIYSNADIYLLDDPISAVDNNVGRFIMRECLNGYLKSKTRILVTHAINYCQFTDVIYLMEQGQITESGQFEEIKKSTRFQQIYEKFNSELSTDKVVAPVSPSKPKRVLSSTSLASTNVKQTDEVEELMLVEDRAKGAITTEIIKQYLTYSGGASSFLLVALIMMAWIVCYTSSSLWIAEWTVESERETRKYRNWTYFFICFGLGFGQAIFAYFRVQTIVNQSIKSAQTIHSRMMSCLLYAPQCQFFERVPQGRIMNRLTKDMNTLDTEIYWNVSWLYTKFGQLISNTFLNVFASTPYIMIPIAVFFWICAKIQRIYMKASRELFRLELISKSPILSYFSESLQGLTTIRAFCSEKDFFNNYAQKLDTNRKIFFSQVQANAWFIQILGLTSFIVNMSAICYSVFDSSTNAAFAGLLMTYASNIDTNICQTVESLGLLENGIISFERCLAYTKVQAETAYKQLVDSLIQGQPHHEKLQLDWPSQGKIEYTNYAVQYRESLPPALKELSFIIEPKQKVGVVGRTGAGKSTMMLTLLRILEASKGSLLIDGIDISQLSLKQLRENITIILQDATIFEGTLRDNLDPLKVTSDADILSVLQQCCLSTVLSPKDGLNTHIQEGGENLSAGQKQLLCIARAILKKSRIILIDEATANIDIDTEQIIQETIRTAFKECTVITIAHRINTILHCDKILVVEKGTIVEEGFTKILLADQSSRFYGIYKESQQNT